MPLVNIRLSADDAAKVKALRDAGVELSQLVREAIRAAHAKSEGRRGAVDARRIIAELDEQYAVPPGAAYHGVDTTDRRAVGRYVRERLLRKRPR